MYGGYNESISAEFGVRKRADADTEAEAENQVNLMAFKSYTSYTLSKNSIAQTNVENERVEKHCQGEVVGGSDVTRDEASLFRHGAST